MVWRGRRVEVVDVVGRYLPIGDLGGMGWMGWMGRDWDYLVVGKLGG